jgi:hypothetical protein
MKASIGCPLATMSSAVAKWIASSERNTSPMRGFGSDVVAELLNFRI